MQFLLYQLAHANPNGSRCARYAGKIAFCTLFTREILVIDRPDWLFGPCSMSSRPRRLYRNVNIYRREGAT